MATLREIRRRIRSVRNISKVTRAMEMVAAAKMRRAQSQALALRPYAEKAREVLNHLAAQRGATEELHPLFAHRSPISRVGLVMITSNKGLAGGYNHNVTRLGFKFLEEATVPVDLITVGRVGRRTMLSAGQRIIADFDDVPDQPGIEDVRGIARVVIEDFLDGTVDEVYLLYTRFINTMVQRPTVRILLPLRHLPGDEVVHMVPLQDGVTEEALPEYIYEPDRQALLAAVVPRFTEVQIYDAILEALASEHSARMVAMRAATENANELIEALTQRYNQARQSAITSEMLDIVGGTEALRQSRQSSRSA